jgi:opacity protein-like surface antigen
MKKILLSLGLMATVLSFNAFADTGPYVELNLGYSATGTSSIDKTKQLVKEQSSHFGYNLNAGVLFLGFGAEAGYTRYADINYHDNSTSAPADLYGLHLALITDHTFGPLMLFGKLGYGQLHRGSFSVDDVKTDSTEKSGLYFGFGGGFKFTSNLAAIVQYQQIVGKGDMPDANLTSAGIRWMI